MLGRNKQLSQLRRIRLRTRARGVLMHRSRLAGRLQPTVWHLQPATWHRALGGSTCQNRQIASDRQFGKECSTRRGQAKCPTGHPLRNGGSKGFQPTHGQHLYSFRRVSGKTNGAPRALPPFIYSDRRCRIIPYSQTYPDTGRESDDQA